MGPLKCLKAVLRQADALALRLDPVAQLLKDCLLVHQKC